MPSIARRFRLVRVGLVLLFGAAVTLGVRAAQDPPPAPPDPPAQQPVFRGGVDSVSVDVTVTDRNGRPVTDLTTADFEVREAGDVQELTSFRLVETGNGVDDPRAASEILSLDQERSEAARLENRLFVIFLDDYHVRRGNSMRSSQQLAQFLRGLSRNDLVAIATPLGGVSAMTFSRNHDLTSSEVAAFEGRKYEYTPKHPIEFRYQMLPVEQQEQMRNQITIATLANICEYLGTLREGRKTLVYVSEGMSGSVPPGVRTTGSIMGSRPTGGIETQRSQSSDFFENSSLQADLQSRVFRAATRNNVSIYTLDPRGLSNFEFGVNEDVSSATDRRILQESTDLLRVIAEETDGRAIVGRNDPLPGLRQMVQDSSAYYLLSYTSSRAPRDGRFHEIEVRVRRPGVEVRARKGYWAYTAEEIARATAPPPPESPAEVTAALDALRTTAATGRNRPVAVWLGAQRSDGAAAAVTLAWEAPATPPADEVDAVARVSIVATTLAGEEVFNGPVDRRSETGRAAGAVTFAAPAGPLRVRITPENARGQRLDSDEASLDVPDFTATGPLLTQPFLYRGRTARDLQAIRTAQSPTPVVSASFGRAERVLIRFGAYAPGGVAPTLAMRVLNQRGDQLAAMPAPVAAQGAAAGTFESQLALGSFPPGEYLVEISAEHDGQRVKSLVALRVTG